jgi:putative two-component system response regulator
MTIVIVTGGKAMGARRTGQVNDGALRLAKPAISPAVLIAGNGLRAAILSESLTQDGFAVTHVNDGWAAIDRLRRCPFDAAMLDHNLPGLDGTEVCRLAKRDQGTRLLPVVLLVPDCGSVEERLDWIEAGADHIVSIPIDLRELIAKLRVLARQKRYTDDLEHAASVMTALSTMIEARDRYTEGHCHRMANHAAMLGRRIGLTGDEIHVLRRGSFLHDIGMLAVPDTVLLKPSRLDADERMLIQSHTVIGESFIANLRSLEAVRSIVRHHHERRDGSGYPDGLRGDDIPLSAQIVGLVDVFEAMTSPRPYQKTAAPQEALAVLRRHAKQGWHSEHLVDEFARMVASS